MAVTADGGGRTAALIATTAAVALGTLVLWRWRRRARGSGSSGDAQDDDEDEPNGLPDISVPEALHVLAHGSLEKKVLAARALTGIVCGEIDVLEEILDEARAKHSEFGGRRQDGRSVLGALLFDLADGPASGNDAEALVDFLLQCCAWDTAWDESDEWNQMTLVFLDHLRKEEKADILLARAAKRLGSSAQDRGAAGDGGAGSGSAAPRSAGARSSAAAASKVEVLQRRLRGERDASAEVADTNLVPNLLSMNTRMFCPTCVGNPYANGGKPLLCSSCRNVAYCNKDCQAKDMERHQCWCFAVA